VFFVVLTLGRKFHFMKSIYRRASQGDCSAVTRVVETLRPRLSRLAAYYARRTGENADDLLQDAWLGLLEALPSLNPDIGSPDQYLLHQARWRLLDAVRRAVARRCVFLEDAGLSDTFLTACPDLGAAWVSEFAGGLKATQQAVLDCLLRGLTWREAGIVLGCTSGNIAWHVRQIQRRYADWHLESLEQTQAVKR
jgi:DNA-directed RNA polymerase specialized sigma24 family protein